MKALVWTGPSQMRVDEVPAPVPGPGTVLLHSRATGICGSEVEGYLGRQANRTPPLIMGHEFAGTVVEVGTGVDRAWLGRPAAVNPLLPCGICALCRTGLTNVCPHRSFIGIQHPGGFAELVRVPETSLYPLPEGTDPATGALAEPLANGVHAVRLGVEAEPADTALILGAGAIGLMVVEAAVLAGISHVAVVEPFAPRRDHAARAGAHATYATGDAARAALLDVTDGLGVGLVIDAVGAASTRRLAIEVLRPAGCLVALGLRDDESPLPFHRVVRNQITVRGSYAYTRDDYQQALDHLLAGRAGIGEIPAPAPLERGPEIFAHLAQGPSPEIKFFLAEDG